MGRAKVRIRVKIRVRDRIRDRASVIVSDSVRFMKASVCSASRRLSCRVVRALADHGKAGV